jgi:hypothetical protein
MLSAAVAAPAVCADGFQLRLGDDIVEASYTAFIRDGNSSITGSWLHNSDADVDLLSGGFFVHGDRREVAGKVGIKAYYADLDRDDGYGLALGGDGTFRFSDIISLNAGIYIGPDALSFSDVEDYFEWFVGVDLNVLQNAVVTVGYRETEIDTKRRNDVEVEDGPYIGLHLKF